MLHHTWMAFCVLPRSGSIQYQPVVVVVVVVVVVAVVVVVVVVVVWWPCDGGSLVEVAIKKIYIQSRQLQ